MVTYHGHKSVEAEGATCNLQEVVDSRLVMYSYNVTLVYSCPRATLKLYWYMKQPKQVQFYPIEY